LDATTVKGNVWGFTADMIFTGTEGLAFGTSEYVIGLVTESEPPMALDQFVVTLIARVDIGRVEKVATGVNDALTVGD
jgi:hypothetical protein